MTRRSCRPLLLLAALPVITALGCGKAEPPPVAGNPTNNTIQIPKGMPGGPESKPRAPGAQRPQG